MITICGPIRKMTVMMNLASFLRDDRRYDSWVNIPDGREFKTNWDLIQHRTEYLNKIGGSRLVIVIAETENPNKIEPRLIIPSAASIYKSIWDASDILAKGFRMYQYELENRYLDRDNPIPMKTIGECVNGFRIGESTSYEMMWALKNKVPFILLRDNNIPDFLITGENALMVPDGDNVFVCSNI